LSSAFGSRPEVAKGNKPAVVFNATIVETGERLLLATTDSEPFRQPTNKTSPGWRDFTRLYPETDIPVATAARLSATFPFVTPAPRIRRGDVFADQYHVVDGGYYDNYGVATLIEWLDQAMKDAESKPSRVLILQIRGSPAGSIDPPKRNYGLFSKPSTRSRLWRTCARPDSLPATKWNWISCNGCALTSTKFPAPWQLSNTTGLIVIVTRFRRLSRGI
jgi:hypothetical protein